MASLVVSNLSAVTRKTELEALFSNPDNGGGEISYILYPLGTDYTRAVVHYVDPGVLDNVCTVSHQLHGKHLRVRPQPKQAFSVCSAEVDPTFLTGLTNVDECCQDLEASFGVETYFTEEGQLTIQGTLLQIQSAQSRLELTYNQQQTELNHELGKPTYEAITTPRADLRGHSVHPVGTGSGQLLHTPPPALFDMGNGSGQKAESAFSAQAKAVDDMFATSVCDTKQVDDKIGGRIHSSRYGEWEVEGRKVDRSLSEETGHVLRSTSSEDTAASKVKSRETQLQVDPFVLKYIRKFDRDKILSIESKNHVQFKYLKSDGVSIVKILPCGTGIRPADFENAQRDLVSIYQSAFYSVVQDTIDLSGEGVTKEEKDEVLKAVKQAFADNVAIATGSGGEVTLIGPWRRTAAASEWIRKKLGLKKAAKGTSMSFSHEASGSGEGIVNRRERAHDGGSERADTAVTVCNPPGGDDATEIQTQDTLKDVPVEPPCSSVSQADVDDLFASQSKTPIGLNRQDAPDTSSVPTQLPPGSMTQTPLGAESQSFDGFSVDDQSVQYKTDQGLTVQTVTQNIARVSADVIVSASNIHLDPISGVAKAIADRGGMEFREACIDHVNTHGALKTAEVISLPASGKLKCNHVIHAVGPMWSLYKDKDQCAHDLRKTFLNAFRLADKVLLAKSIAVPAISTGVYGMPDDVCARSLYEAAQTFSLAMSDNTSLATIIIVNYNEENTAFFSTIFSQLREAGHYMTEPLPSGGYDSDVSSGEIHTKDQHGHKRRLHKYSRKLSEDESDTDKSGSRLVPADAVDLEKLEKRYHQTQPDNDDRSEYSGARYSASDRPDEFLGNRSYSSLGSVARYAPSDHPDDPLAEKSLGSVGSVSRYPPSDRPDRSYSSLGSAARYAPSDPPDDPLSSRSLASSVGSLARYPTSDHADEPWSGARKSPVWNSLHLSEIGGKETCSGSSPQPHDLSQLSQMMEDLKAFEGTSDPPLVNREIKVVDQDLTPVISPRGSLTSGSRILPSSLSHTVPGEVQSHKTYTSPQLSLDEDHFLTSPTHSLHSDDYADKEPGDPSGGIYKGSMTSEVDRKITLPESDAVGAIVMNFTFESPSDSGEVLVDSAYLPNTEAGRHLMHLMRKAFDSGQLIVVKNGETYWDGVEHKRNVTGGKMGNGFPDEDYVLRATEQLEAKGFH